MMVRCRVGTSLPLLAILIGTVLGGCRRGPQDEMAPVQFDGPVPVYVKNENWLEIHVYVMSDTQSRSLGVVATGTEEIFEVPASLAQRADLRFRAEPIGSNARFVSERLYVGSGGAVYFTVANALHLSTVVIR